MQEEANDHRPWSMETSADHGPMINLICLMYSSGISRAKPGSDSKNFRRQL